MIWLACAESLKRRFREAQVRDSTAGTIVGQVDDLEQRHRAVDKFLLDKSHEYGFLPESALTELTHIYEMRCIYGHPYEEAPSTEKVVDAAASVVELVLSKPVLLRHGFAKQLLESLLQDINFLDDYEPAVAAFAENILPRIDEEVHIWLLDNFWEELENISPDSSMAFFFRRGKWFCRAMLSEIGVDFLTADEWHSKLVSYPRILIEVCSLPSLFVGIGRRAQDSLVSAILADSETHSSALTLLEELSYEDALSERQDERFRISVSELETSAVSASGLRTKTCYERLISAMKSYNWYTQNPAISMIWTNGPEQASELSDEHQVILGRNVLQAAEGSSTRALEFLDHLSNTGAQWPIGLLRGIALESFVNDDGETRFKNYSLDSMLYILENLDATMRDTLVSAVVNSIFWGTLDDRDNRASQDKYNEAIELLGQYTWASSLVDAIEDKFETHF